MTTAKEKRDFQNAPNPFSKTIESFHTHGTPPLDLK